MILKKIAAIGLLVLLLYNTFGLTFAILLFETDYKTASPVSQADDWKLVKFYLPSLPYSENWENDEGMEGLLQQEGNFYNTTKVRHESDTLYVTLKSNLAAREQFFELANRMQEITGSKNTSENAGSRTLKLLSDFLKNYIPNSQQIEFGNFTFESVIKNIYQPEKNATYACKDTFLHTPPPEFA